ncbi:MAG: hypothetical protein HY554_03275 [Elusimicrobia bacterium]|nr:hypothetical protein [Elusimicrobiota bacterium]
MESRPDSEALDALLRGLEPPVCIVSTRVGMGNVSVGEALRERLARLTGRPAEHWIVEDLLPESAVTEDLERYRLIVDRAPFLLHLVYRVPLFYYRKLARERLAPTDLRAARDKLEGAGMRSILCVSHRPAFWIAALKRRLGSGWHVSGVLTEFGTSLGWRYIFWDALDAFLSPIGREELELPIPKGTRFVRMPLLAGSAFEALSGRKPDRGSVLIAAGSWGRLRGAELLRVIESLLGEDPALSIHAVCGTNRPLLERLRLRFAAGGRVALYGEVATLAPLMSECAAVITTPGFSTIVEAHAAGRPLFLLPGLPVAEEHNAQYALRNLGARWYGPETFRRWRALEPD